MMAAQRLASLRGELLLNESMAKHTTWRVGGPADRYYRPADLADLVLFISQLPSHEPVFWLGLGSNLLVRDGGIRGTVVITSGLLNEIELLDGNRVRAEAGVACAKVARFCAKAGLTGAEFLAGIPGTLGGALAMNAGAFGGETWQRVVRVETLDRRGQLHHRLPNDYEISYRHVAGPAHEWFVAAELQLEIGAAEQNLTEIKRLLARRNESQPTNQPNAGSVFKNPPGDHAARLIEACGLKGYCIGGACVSEKHANFIINTGVAKAAEIEQLIVHVAEHVKQQHGVELAPEVRIVGDAL